MNRDLEGELDEEHIGKPASPEPESQKQAFESAHNDS